ncbi:MAG: CDP-diacylglycerol--glycerol-3-phosphate 3-phosphatidyltransferase [Oscillospiraceae bacterium]|jgi:CDP-diacylglycerol--glycerol-3-phosphate 3-phosphatidyltransferase|nr:CDP-diacylglycerol--glycerol-3-phosphate 3-phosphatidyltransferase [Oscillospiraceae bacterium]
MNLANKLTLLRVLMIPAFLGVLYWGGPNSEYIALAIFVIASLTDFLDGYIARSRGLVTDFGKFMDPLADKVLVTTAMLWFVQTGVMPAWAVAVVIFREFAISGIRLIAAERGRVIAAAWSGKIKTAATMVFLMLMFLPLPGWVDTLGVWVIVVTTVYSGLEYLVKNKDVIDWSKL